MRWPRSGSLLAAQVSLITLPDELLGSILRRAWADRPLRPAADEVCRAAGLACVCRRVRALLRERPLPLALDFSAARTSEAQRRWLLKPAQAGRVEAASFDSKDVLWEQPVLDDFLARHGGTLLRLSGVPLHLVARASQAARSDLDLSGLRLSKLGTDCDIVSTLLHLNNNACMWLWPVRLPGTLEELHLLGPEGEWLNALAWAPQSSAGLAGRLPRLHTLRVTCVGGGQHLSIDKVPLLEGCPVLLAFDVHTSGADVTVDAKLFGRAGHVHVEAGGRVSVWNSEEDVAVCVDRLCPAGLQAAELCAARPIQLTSTRRFRFSMREVVREMISRCGSRFAIEVGVAVTRGEGPGDMASLIRLAWRRWPAPGAPEWPAASGAHERARAWAAAGGQDVEDEHDSEDSYGEDGSGDSDAYD